MLWGPQDPTNYSWFYVIPAVGFMGGATTARMAGTTDMTQISYAVGKEKIFQK